MHDLTKARKRRTSDWLDAAAIAVLLLVILTVSLPVLMSGNRLSLSDPDFFQYPARHEAVCRSLMDHGQFPLRSHWFGGGYPTLGDPEDPSLNPLIVLSLVFGVPLGLKVAVFLALLVGAVSTYALTRRILGYPRWGALFSALVFGTSLFVPLRAMSGNTNEIYAAFLPLCLYLLGMACRGRRAALLALPLVFYVMLSDGKLTALMVLLYTGGLCLLAAIPPLRVLNSDPQTGWQRLRPAAVLAFALAAALLIGMVRFLPALELIQSRGGLADLATASRPPAYMSPFVKAYEIDELLSDLVIREKDGGLVSVGWTPVILFAASFARMWRRSLPWLILCLGFGWLLLAHNAPFDLFAFLSRFPVFSAISRPVKYFSFQIVFTLAVASGQFFFLLRRLRRRWVEHLAAAGLAVTATACLYPRMATILSRAYDFDPGPRPPAFESGFWNVQSAGFQRNDPDRPLGALTFLNVIRNVGTIDWYTGMPIGEHALPRYFVDEDNRRLLNVDYRGEAFFANLMPPTDANGSTRRAAPFPAPPSGFWPLDAIRAGRCRDASGNDRPGYLLGANRTTSLVRGVAGNAVFFGDGHWLDVAPAPLFELGGEYTISAWIYSFQFAPHEHRVVVEAGDRETWTFCGLSLSEGRLGFQHGDDTAALPFAAAGLRAHGWHHLAGVAEAQRLKLYVDGTLKATSPRSPPPRRDRPVHLRIGAATVIRPPSHFEGLIDEVAVWDRALSDAEIAALHRPLANLTAGTAVPAPNRAEADIHPNTITVRVEIDSPGTLVVNQNHHRDWRTDRGTLFNAAGLLGVRLERPGRYAVNLRYAPGSFRLGLGISLVSLLAFVMVCRAPATARLLAGWRR